MHTLADADTSTQARAARRTWVVALLLAAAFCSFMPCLTPFSAFAVVLAATFRAKPALFVMGGVWLINQSIGYGFLGYPHAWDSYTWGVVTLLAALAGMGAAFVVLRRLARVPTAARIAIAYLAAHAAYEIVLYAATPWLGGAEAFALPIMTRIFLGNAAWLAGFVLFNEVLAFMLARRGAAMPRILRAA